MMINVSFKGIFAILFALQVLAPSAHGEPNVFGDDGRIDVDQFSEQPTKKDLVTAPRLDALKSVVKIRAFLGIDANGDSISSGCTGSLVGEDLILTNRHCVAIRENGAWTAVNSATAAVGYQMGRYRARSNIDLSNCKIGLGSINDSESDWAICPIQESLGKTYGYLKIKNQKMNENDQILLAGNHDDRTNNLTLQECHVRQTPTYAAGTIAHDCATAEGSSGAPILKCDNAECSLVALNQSMVFPSSIDPSIKAKLQSGDLPGLKLKEYSVDYRNVAISPEMFVNVLENLKKTQSAH